MQVLRFPGSKTCHPPVPTPVGMPLTHTLVTRRKWRSNLRNDTSSTFFRSTARCVVGRTAVKNWTWFSFPDTFSCGCHWPIGLGSCNCPELFASFPSMDSRQLFSEPTLKLYATDSATVFGQSTILT